MFPLNINGIFVLTMFKTTFTAVPLTSQHPLEKAHVPSSSAPLTNHIQDRGAYKHKNFRLVS